MVCGRSAITEDSDPSMQRGRPASGRLGSTRPIHGTERRVAYNSACRWWAPGSGCLSVWGRPCLGVVPTRRNRQRCVAGILQHAAAPFRTSNRRMERASAGGMGRRLLHLHGSVPRCQSGTEGALGAITSGAAFHRAVGDGSGVHMGAGSTHSRSIVLQLAQGNSPGTARFPRASLVGGRPAWPAAIAVEAGNIFCARHPGPGGEAVPRSVADGISRLGLPPGYEDGYSPDRMDGLP